MIVAGDTMRADWRGQVVVGCAIFQQLYRSGVKVTYVDLDQVGLCYPNPAEDPHNHRVRQTIFPGQGPYPFMNGGTQV